MRFTFIIFLICTNVIVQAQCISNESFTLSPSGPYEVGDIVEVNYTLGNFYQLNINWIIAFQINLGEGWTNLTPLATPLNINTNNDLGEGFWVWDNQNTYPSGLNFGPGFRFINTSWNDNIYMPEGNEDWGSSSKGPLSMSFKVTVGQTCSPDDLSISVNVFGDCLTGGWYNGSCCSDPAFPIYNGAVLLGSDLDAGEDETLLYCSESNPFNLFDQLNGSPQTGGVWSPSLPSGFLGVFDPSVNSAQEYVYTVSDECNSESSSVTLIMDQLSPNEVVELQLCENAPIISLYSQLGINNTTGSWSGVSELFDNPSPDYFGLFNSQQQTFGDYVYTVLNANGCQINYPVEVSLIDENINAGNNYTLDICSDEDGINFFDLIGNPDINGTWSPVLSDGYLGFFDPSSNLSGVYTYNVSGECSTNQSQVNVSIVNIVPPPIIPN